MINIIMCRNQSAIIFSSPICNVNTIFIFHLTWWIPMNMIPLSTSASSFILCYFHYNFWAIHRFKMIHHASLVWWDYNFTTETFRNIPITILFIMTNVFSVSFNDFWPRSISVKKFEMFCESNFSIWSCRGCRVKNWYRTTY